MNQIRSRGFTLIELLVVIAIIGILSAVVLASLTGARTKGNDSAIKANISTIQTQAEIYYGGAGNNTYSGSTVTGAVGSCATASTLWADPTIKQAVMSATSTLGGESEGPTKDYMCTSQAQTYMFINRLSTTGLYWCVDNTGVVKQESAMPAASTFSCP